MRFSSFFFRKMSFSHLENLLLENLIHGYDMDLIFEAFLADLVRLLIDIYHLKYDNMVVSLSSPTPVILIATLQNHT